MRLHPNLAQTNGEISIGRKELICEVGEEFELAAAAALVVVVVVVVVLLAFVVPP